MLSDNLSHRSLMNQIYAKQRFIYDGSRKFYLLGRDQLIFELRPPNNGHVLEVGCGTGRNLILAAKTRSRAKYFGIDISDEMLKSANKLIVENQLTERVKIAHADATAFKPDELFGIQKFDRIFISYSLSMIPDWKSAIDHALTHLSDSGSLNIVDFGQQSELPRWFRTCLSLWLKLFHVTPRIELAEYLETISPRNNRSLVYRKPYRDYACYFILGPKRTQYE